MGHFYIVTNKLILIFLVLILGFSAIVRGILGRLFGNRHKNPLGSGDEKRLGAWATIFAMMSACGGAPRVLDSRGLRSLK